MLSTLSSPSTPENSPLLADPSSAAPESNSLLAGNLLQVSDTWVEVVCNSIFNHSFGWGKDWQQVPNLMGLCLTALRSKHYTKLTSLVEDQLLKDCKAKPTPSRIARTLWAMSHWPFESTNKKSLEKRVSLIKLSLEILPYVWCPPYAKTSGPAATMFKAVARMALNHKRSAQLNIQLSKMMVNHCLNHLNFLQIIETACTICRFRIQNPTESELIAPLVERAHELAQTPNSIDSAQLNCIMNAFVTLRAISNEEWFIQNWGGIADLMPSQMNYQQLMVLISATPQRPRLAGTMWEFAVYLSSVERAAQLAKDLTPPEQISLACRLAVAGSTLSHTPPTELIWLDSLRASAKHLIDQAIRYAPTMNALDCLMITMLLHNVCFKNCLDDTFKEEAIQMFVTKAEQLSSTVTTEQARLIFKAIKDLIRDDPALVRLFDKLISSAIDKISDSEFTQLPDWYFDTPQSKLEVRIKKSHRQLILEGTMHFVLLFDREYAPEDMQRTKSLLIQRVIDSINHLNSSGIIEAMPWVIDDKNNEPLPTAKHRFPHIEDAFARRALTLAKEMPPEEALTCFFLVGRFLNSEIRDEACLALQQNAAAASHESTDHHASLVDIIDDGMGKIHVCTESFLLQTFPPLIRDLAHILDEANLNSMMRDLNETGHSTNLELVKPSIAALLPRIGQLIPQMSVDEEMPTILEVLSVYGFRHDELVHAWAAFWKEYIPNLEPDEDYVWPLNSVLPIAGMLHGYDDLAKQLVDLMTPQLEKMDLSEGYADLLSIAITLRNLNYAHEPLIRFLKKQAIDSVDEDLDPYPFWLALGSVLKEIEITPAECVSDDLPDASHPLDGRDLLTRLTQLNKTGHEQGPAAVVPSLQALMPQIMQWALSRSANLLDLTDMLQIVAMYGIEHQELAKLWAGKVTQSPNKLDPMTCIGTAGLVKGCNFEMRQVIDLMIMPLKKNTSNKHKSAHVGVIATTLRNLNYYPEPLVAFQRNRLNPGSYYSHEYSCCWQMFNNMLERGMPPAPSIPTSSHDDLNPPSGKRQRRV